MKSRRLLTALFALCVLCAAVFGLLSTGASAEENLVLYAVGDLEAEGAIQVESIQDALADLEKNSRKWSADTTAEIRITGTDHSGGAQDGVLFGQVTIWREDGTKLPIKILGVDTSEERDAYIYLDSAGGWYACANDYTFENLTLPVGDQETFFFAGSGDVRFVNCDLTSGGGLTVETVQDRTDTYMNAKAAAEYIAADAANLITPDVGRLPCGDAWQTVRNSAEYHATGTVLTDKNGDAYVDKDLTGKNGTPYGDYSHAGNTGGGQYLNACVYYEAILGLECKDNSWRPTAYALDETLVPILQKAAHDAVVEVYGEDHFKTPIDADIDDNGVINLLMMGSSSSYYMRDELHLMARHIGIDLRVVHAYSSGIKMSTQWSWANNGTGKWTVYTEWDGKTSSGVQNQKLSDYVGDYPWDVIVTYQTGNAFNKKNLGGGYTDETVAKALEGCSTADDFINFVYSYNDNSNANARYFWFQTVGAPIGAPGPGGTAKGSLYGDNCTSAVYAGWTAEDLARYTENGKLAASSITLGEGANYGTLISAVGYISTAHETALTDETAKDVRFLESSGFEEYTIPEVLPVNTVGKFVVDGATIGAPEVHLGYSPASAIFHVKAGTTGSITTCNKDANPRYGDVSIKLTGGQAEQIDALRNGILDGNLSFYMDDSDGEVYLGGMLRMGFGTHSVDGDITVDVRGGSVGTVYSGGYASGNIYNSFSDCELRGDFFAVRVGNANRVVNTFKNCTLLKNYYGGHWDSKTIQVVENHVDGITVEGDYYGGSFNEALATTISGGKVKVDGKEEDLAIYNDIKSMTVKGNYYGGSYSGVMGNILNDIESITVEGNYYGAHYAAIANTKVGNLRNKVEGGTFKGTYYGGTFGSITGAKVGDLVNDISGGTFKKGFFGGSKIRTTNSVTNNISGGVFENPTAKNSDGNTVSLHMFMGGSEGGPITKNVTNNISGGTFNCHVILGSGYAVTGSVINNISGGTFALTSCGAGKGKISGNVENTISGTASFKKGFYAGYSLSDSNTISKNIINKVQPGPTEKLPYFGKAPAYNLSKDGTVDSIYAIGNSDFGFMGGNNNGTVSGYVENEISGGYFYGHWHGGNNKGAIKGKNADGYCIINQISGGTLAYRAYGGTVSSNTLGGNIMNEISGGTFKYGYVAGHRAGTNSLTSTTFSQDIYTHIYGDPVFEQYVCGVARGWNVDQSARIRHLGDAVLTIEGGTFKGDVYGLCNNGEYYDATRPGARIDEGGSVTVNVNGGAFEGVILATSPNFDASIYHEDARATVNIAATKGNISIQKELGSRFTNEIFTLQGGDHKIILGADAKLDVSAAFGDVKLGQTETWKKQTYVTLPEGNTAKITVTGPHCFDRVGDSVVAVKGGIQLSGATMILTDRVAVRALFDKASVDQMDDFTFTFVMGEETLASGTKADLEAYGDAYYGIVLAKIGAKDFTTTVAFTGSDLVWENEFSVELLADVAEEAWEGNPEGVALAKALHNFATIVASPTATLPNALTPEKVEGFKASGSMDADASFKVTGKGLVMGNAVGIRIYGTSPVELTKENITVTVNGKNVNDLMVISKGAGENEYCIDLYVNAKNMSDALKIVIKDADGKTALDLTDRVDAIAASYPATHEKYATVQQLLVYIQAAVAYASAL